MEVTSILDAYTAAYGWTVYKLFFIYMVIIGAPFYPIIVRFMDLIKNYAERGGDPEQLIKASYYYLSVWFIVVFVGFLPLAPINMEVSQIRNACGLQDLNQNSNFTEYQFEFEESRAPIGPWAAMQLASGLKRVIFERLPCVEDLTSTNQALRSLDLSKGSNPVELNAEQGRFSQECFTPSAQHYQRTIRGDYGQAAADRMRTITNTYKEVNNTSREMILSLPSSSFFREYFYKKPTLCNGLTEPDVMYYFCLGLPIKSQGPVDQIVGADTSLLSEYQKSVNETIPTCSEWFDTPNKGLRDRLYAASESKLKDSAAYVVSNVKSVDIGLSVGAGNSTAILNTVRRIVGGGDEAYKNFLVDRLYTNQAEAGNLLSDQNRTTLNALTGAGVVGSVLGVFNVDIAQSIGQDAVAFYSSAMMFKIAASFFQPLLLMAIFMFWAIYIVIAEMGGRAMMQGLIIIFIISIIPGIWAIGNHLDDKLYVAMFPQTETLVDIFKNPADHLERLMLDIVSTVFYVILPLILIYVTVMAGVNTQTASVFMKASNDPSSSGGKTTGNKLGGHAGKISNNARGGGLSNLKSRFNSKAKRLLKN